MENQITYESLLDGNKAWVKEMLQKDPDFFSKLSQGQTPPILWIGCSDSRVPATEITGRMPGEIFVHRNIANMVVHSDMNMLSVLDYAVNVLKVKHVIVCGHYGCGGVAAAIGQKQFGLIDNWLRHIKDVYRLHKDELDSFTNEKEKLNRFVELNIIEQVYDLCKTSIIQNSWEKNDSPAVHGWVYDVANGLIKDLDVNITNNKQMAEIFRFEANGIHK